MLCNIDAGALETSKITGGQFGPLSDIVCCANEPKVAEMVDVVTIKSKLMEARS